MSTNNAWSPKSAELKADYTGLPKWAQIKPRFPKVLPTKSEIATAAGPEKRRTYQQEVGEALQRIGFTEQQVADELRERKAFISRNLQSRNIELGSSLKPEQSSSDVALAAGIIGSSATPLDELNIPRLVAAAAVVNRDASVKTLNDAQYMERVRALTTVPALYVSRMKAKSISALRDLTP